MKYTVHLRCRFIKNSPRRTSSTPAGVFYTLLASAPSISKRHFRTVTEGSAEQKLAVNAPKDGRGIGQKQGLEQNLSSTDVHGRILVERYTDVRLLTMYLYHLFAKALDMRHICKKLRYRFLECPIDTAVSLQRALCGIGF